MKNKKRLVKIQVKIKYLHKAMFLAEEPVEENWYLVFCFCFKFIPDKFFIFYNEL